MELRGVLGRELPAGNFLSTLQTDAEGVLIGTAQGVVEEFGDRAWDELDRKGTERAGRMMVPLAEFAGRLSRIHLEVAEANLSGVALEALFEAVDEVEEMLPFSRREARWFGGSLALKHVWAEFGRGGFTGQLNAIRRRRVDVMTNGRMEVLDGAELVDREWNWMRSAGEFASSSYPHGMPQALRELTVLFDRESIGRDTLRRLGVPIENR